MPLLLHIMEDRVIHKFNLKDGTVNIGRNKDNDIKLDDRTISGYHARLTIKPHHNPYLNLLKEVEIKDLDSTNGTFVNDKRIENKTLHDGDILQFGDHKFKYEDQLDK
jgi:pSer/pThr/pTyr-binding forkhead associated (FHA) protein